MPSTGTSPISAADLQSGFGAAAATPHFLATEAALAVMDGGGNAVDSMIAANAVLGVVAPETCGIGGDLFALVHQPGWERPLALNASGVAGSGADAEALRRAGYNRVPPTGRESVTIPGCVDGWLALGKRCGALGLASLLVLAIELARNGFPASPELAATLDRQRGVLASQPASNGLYPNGRPPVPGETLTRPQLATVLEEIGQGGRDAFYTGSPGRAISHATGGIITGTDLAQRQAEWVEPIKSRIYGLDGFTVPPNSQGYLTLAAAAIYEQRAGSLDCEDPAAWHLALEAYRVMATDRNEIACDPRRSRQPPEMILDPEHLAARAAMIDPGRAGPFPPPGPAPGGTAFMCALDAGGMAVSLIQSNYMGIGCGIGVEGFFLHNRGAGFDLRPGHPNEMAPGFRPLHTLSPTLWVGNGIPAMLLGTRGGDLQPQLLLQMVDRVLGAEIPEEEAQGRPRWTIDHRGEVAVESHTPASTVDALGKLGHKVRRVTGVQGGWGPVSIIRQSKAGQRTAAADPRVATTLAVVRP
jgi:gamma-glutamyltranspeptidase/glutathione hydrolase